MAKGDSELSRKRKAEGANATPSDSKKARLDQSVSTAASSAPQKPSKNGVKQSTPSKSSGARDGAQPKLTGHDGTASRPDDELNHRQRRDQARKARIAQKRAEEGVSAELNGHAEQGKKKLDAEPVHEEETEIKQQARAAKKAAKRKARQERHKEKAAAEKSVVAVEDAEQAVVPASQKTQQDISPDEQERRRRKKLAKKAKRAAQKPQNNAALAEPNDAEASQPGWSLSKPLGGRFVDQDPIFVQDPDSGDEFVIAATSREVQVLSIETSLLVRSRELPGQRQVMAIALDRSRGCKSVHIMAHDRTYFTWDWASDSPVQAINSTPNPVLALADAEGAGLFYVVDMGSRTAVCHGERALFSTTRRLESLQVLGEADYIVAQGKFGVIIGKKKDTQHERPDYHCIELPLGKEIFCFDARLTTSRLPDRRDPKRKQILSIAVGVEEGQILLYEDVGSVFAQQGQQALPTPRILHWHREAPSAVKFNRDGNYLVSGGKETVLVLWQLETGHKQTLPHLTSEVERIAVNLEGDKYALQMGDNSIMVISTSELKPVANFAGLQCEVSIRRAGDKVAIVRSQAVALMHPAHQNLLLLTVPSSQPKTLDPAAIARPFLQTFDIRASRHVTRQALTRNNVTDFNLGPEKTPIAPPDVAHLAISHDGKWLATVDDWMPPASDVEFAAKDNNISLAEQRLRRREVYIKFWQWDDSQKLWTLSTRVDASHARIDATKGSFGAGAVLQLVSDPFTTGFATVGEEGTVKFWRPRTRIQNGVAMKTENDVDIVEWTCKRTIGLPMPGQGQRADSPLEILEAECKPSTVLVNTCMAYSQDGSILAVAQSFKGDEQQPVLHYIDSIDGSLNVTKSVVGIAPGEQIKAIAFLDRYLIAVQQRLVQISDLITESPVRRLCINPHGAPLLSVNYTDGTFAIAAGKKVVVHKPDSAEMLYKDEGTCNMTAVLSAKNQRGYTIVFEDATIRTLTPTTASHSALALLDEIAPESDAVAAAEDVSMVEGVEAPEDEAVALPAVGDLALDEGEDDRPVVRPEQLASIFDVPQSYAMPPVKDMFDAVVGLFGRKPRVAVREVMDVE
ncbi:WD40 repeat protein [Teratosphaeria destructans]|uniref:WD40 repeat protein n=1 Tax=Teratosphaeria destructans TaxID=418781 RepID=A0A9W7SVZ1_9PEZI|nr:WD40 repeat protein [Teratosphaeria destructans]